jgi:acetolactate synthase-1/2/3 large subunit
MASASLAAVQAALGPPGCVATLIIPADCQWAPGPAPLSASVTPTWREARESVIQEAAHLLRNGRTGLLLGGSALTAAGLRAAARVAAASGCPLWLETFPARQECGRHVPVIQPLPYFPEQATEALGNLTGLVLAGAREPVAFFAYPDQPSRLLPEGAEAHALADPEGDVDAALALEALAEALDAPTWAMPPDQAAPLPPRSVPLTADRLCQLLAAQLPERAIVMNEATTAGFTWNTLHAAQAAPHTMLFSTGGAIGQGLPNALGAALACPDRQVIAFQADGSGLYTLQALWSMVREQVDVTVVVCANRCYRILQVELERAGCREPGPTASSLTELTRPEISWTDLAKGFGMPACRVRSELELDEALRRCLVEPGPSLIEALL